MTYKIDADATPDDIKALVAQSQKRSAVYDIITNPTNVTVEVAVTPLRRDRGAGAGVRTTTVVIGAGQAGLAMSWCLAAALDRPRGPRARRGRQLLADRALGFAPAAHAELAEPAARLRLRGRRSGRLPHDARDHRVHRALRDARVARPCGRTTRSLRCAARTTATRSSPTRAPGTARRSCSPPARATSRRSRAVGRAVPPAHRHADAAAVPQPGPARAGRRARRRRLRHGHADRRRDPALRPARDAGGRRARARAPRSTAAGTSSGGWTPPACSTSATTRSTTSCGAPATVPRSSSPAMPTAATSTSTRSPRIGVKLVGRLAGVQRRQGAVLRIAAQPVRAGRPQDEPAARHDRRVGGGKRR